MKQLLSLLIVWFASTVNAEPFHSFWPTTYKPADNIVTILDSTRYNTLINESELINKLYIYYSHHLNIVAIKWRALYFNAWSESRKGNRENALKLITKAARLVNKNIFGYDYHRIQCLKSNIEANVYGKFYQDYVVSFNSMPYYKSIGDYIMVADCYNNMGNVMKDLNETTSMLNNYLYAKKYYDKAGADVPCFKEKLNIADYYTEIGDNKNGRLLLLNMENNIITKRDLTFHLNVLATIVSSYGSQVTSQRTYYIQKMKNLYKKCSDKRLVNLCELNIAQYYFDCKDYNKSLERFLSAKKFLDNSKKSFGETQSLLMIGYCYKELKNYKSASEYFFDFIISEDSLRKANNVFDLQRNESLSKIKQFNSELKHEKEKAHSRMMIIIIFSLSVILCILLFFYNRHKKEQMSRKLKESENRELSLKLENEELKSREQQLRIEIQTKNLVQKSKAISDRDNILKSVMEQISDGEGHKDVSNDMARKINSKVKMQVDSDMKWDILSGMDTKQIAYIFNVQPESIKKARFRLRKKLKLDSDASIEDYLKKLNEGSDKK
jgi:tetratricopeptide (TPR) repeat protein